MRTQNLSDAFITTNVFAAVHIKASKCDDHLSNCPIHRGFLWRWHTQDTHFQRWLKFSFSLQFLWHFKGCGCGCARCACTCSTFGNLSFLLTFKATGNGKWFAVLKTKADVWHFGNEAHCKRSCSYDDKCALHSLHELSLRAGAKHLACEACWILHS